MKHCESLSGPVLWSEGAVRERKHGEDCLSVCLTAGTREFRSRAEGDLSTGERRSTSEGRKRCSLCDHRLLGQGENVLGS